MLIERNEEYNKNYILYYYKDCLQGFSVTRIKHDYKLQILVPES